jgi:choline kinase
MILAAGQGTRLAPLTNDRPKALVELAGASLLHHQVAVLKQAGVTDIIVLTGYYAEQIAGRGFCTVSNPDYADSNMVHTLFCASDLMEEDTDLIISYGDIVYELQVLRDLMNCDAPVAVTVDSEWRRYWELRMEDPLTDCETLKIGSDGSLIELGRKPRDYSEIQGQYIGLIKVRKDYVPKFRQVYECMDPEGPYDGKSRQQMYMTSFIQCLIDQAWPIRAVLIANGWLEVDTFSELQLYNRMQDEGLLAEFCQLDPLAADKGV